MTRIAVLGAGIAGVITAHHLHEADFGMTVIDRHRCPTMETSYANGGQFSASNAEVWTTRSTLIKGLRWMLRRDAPLLVHPAPRWHKLSWMAEFVGDLGDRHSDTLATVRMATAARPIPEEMAAPAGIEHDHADGGLLRFGRTPWEMALARRVSALCAEGGLVGEDLSSEEVAEREPRLATPLAGGS